MKQLQRTDRVPYGLFKKACGRNSACGYDNSNYTQKNGEWICVLCYESVTPIKKVGDSFIQCNIIKPKEKYLWMNRDTHVMHRKSPNLSYGRKSFSYVCVMKHFKRDYTTEYPIDDDNNCELCKSKLVQIKHPVFANKKIFVNLKDSRVHFRRNKLKWTCII